MHDAIAKQNGCTRVGGRGDVFPWGDGQPGGDFRFRFDVLPGDANGDGAVDGGDLAALVDGGFSTMFGAGYLIRNDLDGNGRVDVVDAVMARNHLGASLPVSEPAASPAAAGALLTRRSERFVPENSAPPAGRREVRRDVATSAQTASDALADGAINGIVDLRAARVHRARQR